MRCTSVPEITTFGYAKISKNKLAIVCAGFRASVQSICTDILQWVCRLVHSDSLDALHGDHPNETDIQATGPGATLSATFAIPDIGLSITKAKMEGLGCHPPLASKSCVSMPYRPTNLVTSFPSDILPHAVNVDVPEVDPLRFVGLDGVPVHHRDFATLA